MPFPEGLPTKLVHLTATSPASGKPATGSVRLSPNVPAIVIDDVPVQWTGGGTYQFDADGQLVDGETVGVELLDNSAAGSNPTGWLWHAIINIGNQPASFYFTLEGQPDEVDLAKILQLDPVAPDYVAVPGPQGNPGPAGAEGNSGAPGATGASAYDVAVAAGFTGTEAEWLATLIGPQGDTGPQGPQPPLGAAGTGPTVALRSDDPTTTNSRPPTAHKTSHATGGSDPLSPADIGAEPAGTAAAAVAPLETALPLKADKTGATFTGPVNVVGANLTVQRADGEGAYRLRVTGGALDFEVAGDVIVSTWSEPDFTGTQKAVMRWEPAGPHLIGRVQIGTNADDVVFDLDAAGGKLGLFGATAVAQQTVPGSRADGTALANALAALDAVGLIDNTSVAGIANPWRRRDLPDLLIADSLSTETLTAPTSAVNASPQLATAVQVPPATGPYQYCGAGDFAFGATSPDTNYYLPTSKTPHSYATPQSTWSTEWCTNAPRLEVRFKYISTATMYRLCIDGRPMTQLMQALPTNITYTAGSGYRMLLDLGSAKARRWRLDFSTFPFGGIYVEPAYDVWRPSTRGGRMVVLGDSISDGSAGNTGGGNGTWFKRFARMIGCNDDWDQAKGQTGYINPGTSQTFVDRAQPDVVAYNPERVFVFGGYNDTAATQSQLQTAAASVFTTLKTGLPSSQIIVIGCWSPTATPATGLQNIDAWLRQSAQTAGLPFISPQSGAVYNASGTLIQTDGAWITAGNQASYVYATDSVHPTDAGHAAIARRVYDAYTALLAA